MPQASSQANSQANATSWHLRRLVDFAEPRRNDNCLDVGGSGIALAIRPLVRDVITTTARSLPSEMFTLVTASLALGRSDDQTGLVHDLLQVCGGRLVLADLVRTRAADSDRIERLHDPAYTTKRTLPELLDVIKRAGGWARRIDMFTVERPIEPWLVEAPDPERIRRELIAELDGGPLTGARPRMIGNELWFAQSWAFFAIEPISRPRRGPGQPPR